MAAGLIMLIDLQEGAGKREGEGRLIRLPGLPPVYYSRDCAVQCCHLLNCNLSLFTFLHFTFSLLSNIIQVGKKLSYEIRLVITNMSTLIHKYRHI